MILISLPHNWKEINSFKGRTIRKLIMGGGSFKGRTIRKLIMGGGGVGDGRSTKKNIRTREN